MDETKDVAVDIDTEVEETTDSNESGNEESTDLAEQLEKQRKANAQILARAKKAEEDLKKLKLNSTSSNIKNNNPDISDELKLIARGYSDEVIEQAKVIAKGRSINLLEAIKDPLVVSFANDLKEKQKKEDAKLGATSGSGESSDETLIKPNMSREEHMKVFKEVTGK